MPAHWPNGYRNTQWQLGRNSLHSSYMDRARFALFGPKLLGQTAAGLMELGPTSVGAGMRRWQNAHESAGKRNSFRRIIPLFSKGRECGEFPSYKEKNLEGWSARISSRI